MTYEEAIEKALKFIKLSKSDNANEAALAAAKAQEIIERFKLDIGSLDTQAPERPKEEVKDHSNPLHASRNLSRWKAALAGALCNVNACNHYYRGGNIHLIGRMSDVQTVRYLFPTLVNAVDALAEQHSGNGKTWLNNFRIGAVETISQRLQEQVRQTREEVKAEAVATGSEAALMRVNKALARLDEDVRETKEWTKKNMKFRARTFGQWRHNGEARLAGRKAGETVHLGAARAGLGA